MCTYNECHVPITHNAAILLIDAMLQSGYILTKLCKYTSLHTHSYSMCIFSFFNVVIKCLININQSVSHSVNRSVCQSFSQSAIKLASQSVNLFHRS